MPIFTKKQALAAANRRTVDVPLPELGGEMRLASLLAAPAIKLQSLSESKDPGAVREIALTVLEHSPIDEAGKPLFTRAEAVKFIEEVASPETLALILKSFPRPEKTDVGAAAGN